MAKGGWVANGPDLDGIWKPNHFKPDKWTPFFQNPFEIRTKMSGFRMVGTKAIAEARPIENPTFKKSIFCYKREVYCYFTLQQVAIKEITFS